MELIPILSTIILVATISTFLLAIGAYILYKVREKRGQQVSAPQPSAVKAELVTPVAAPAQQPSAGRVAPQPGYAEQAPVYRQPVRQPIFVQQQGQRVSPPVQQRPQPGVEPAYQAQQPRQYPAMPQQRGYQGPSYIAPGTRPTRESRFLQYTSEGYVPAKEDKNAGTLKWR